MDKREGRGRRSKRNRDGSDISLLSLFLLGGCLIVAVYYVSTETVGLI